MTDTDVPWTEDNIPWDWKTDFDNEVLEPVFASLIFYDGRLHPGLDFEERERVIGEVMESRLADHEPELDITPVELRAVSALAVIEDDLPDTFWLTPQDPDDDFPDPFPC